MINFQQQQFVIIQIITVFQAGIYHQFMNLQYMTYPPAGIVNYLTNDVNSGIGLLNVCQ